MALHYGVTLHVCTNLKNVILKCKLKNIREFSLLESILIRKKILCIINFVLIKFSPNVLLFKKLRMNEKIHHSSIRLRVLGRTTEAQLSSLHLWLVTIEVFARARLAIQITGAKMKIFASFYQELNLDRVTTNLPDNNAN